MRITAKAEYACLAVIELARSWGESVPKRVREVADVQRIPEQYLIQILLQLKAAGLVESSRGSVGGYRLAKNPSEISVAEVIAAIEGRGARGRKVRPETCPHLFDVLERASAAEWDVLARTSIAHLADHPFVHDWVL
jgi:Rrf2 family protein